MAVTIVPEPEDVLVELESILSVVYQAIETGIEKAQEYEYQCADDRAKDPYLASHVFRHHARAVLRDIGITAIDLDEKVALSGIRFVFKNFNFKMLKSDSNGGIPSAGRSQAKRDFYAQRSMDPEMLGLDAEEIIHHPLNLVFLWGVDGDYALSSVSLACPKSPKPTFSNDGSVLASAEMNWQIPIDHPASAAPTIVIEDDSDELEIETVESEEECAEGQDD